MNMSDETGLREDLGIGELEKVLNLKNNRHYLGRFLGILHTNGTTRVVVTGTKAERTYKQLVDDYEKEIKTGSTVSVVEIDDNGYIEIYFFRNRKFPNQNT